MKKDIRKVVRKKYGEIAKKGGSCCSQKSCCGTVDVKGLATEIGYSQKDLAVLPEGANMGLSCGNPGAIASLKVGEIVMDLGCGGGFDVFITARQVGRKGRVIGVDMTPEMLERARKNAEIFAKKTGLKNVEFRLGEIEHLPAADNSVDVIISNCVINLSSDKPQVWREIARVLKSGGRVAVSDIGLLKKLPHELAKSMEMLVGCVAGAIPIARTIKLVKDAGLVVIKMEKKPEYINSLADENNELYRSIARRLSRGSKVSDYITSFNLSAIKP